MQLKIALLLVVLLLFLKSTYGQNKSDIKVNTSGAEAYFEVATLLTKGTDEKSIPWQRLFQSPAYQMLIAGRVIDTAVLKSEMSHVFSSANANLPKGPSVTEKYHKAYQDNLKELENYTAILHKLNVVDSVKSLLYPFLPLRLQTEELFPILFYLNYGSAEATGSGGFVLNDLLHSYKIDKYKFGLLAAHEAFHATVSVAFQQRLKQNIDYNAVDLNLLYFLQNVSEEGIADLIDKPLLLHKKSPLYTEVKDLVANDEVLSISLLKKLDSVLTLANKSETVILQYGTFPVLANAFGKNGGHIPGRFMGSIIKKADLLPSHIKTVEDPVSFIITYNAAAKKSSKKYPLFSKESIAYLQKVRLKYWLQKGNEAK